MTPTPRPAVLPAIAPAIAALAFAVAAGPARGAAVQSPPAPTAETDSRSARCALPDLAGVEPTVRRQLEEAAATTAAGARESAPTPRQAADYGALGRHLHAYGLLPAAERCYVAAARLAPEEPAWPHLLGIVLENEGRTADARRHYARALALTRATPTLVRLAELERRQGNLDAAERLLREALEHGPDEAAALAAMGQIALSRRDYAQAVRYLGAALEAAPSADALHVPLALAHRQLGHRDLARRHLAQRGTVGVTVADPDLAAIEALRGGEVPNLLRGREAFAAGDYAAAAEAFAAAVEAAPESVRARLNLAAALGEADRTEAALEQLDAVLALDPEHASAHFNRGILLVRGGRDAAAVEALLSASRLDPADPEAPLQAAAALARLGRDDEALHLYEKVIREHPERSAAWLGAADLLLRRGDVAAARARLEEAHRVLPNAPEVAAALSRLDAMRSP